MRPQPPVRCQRVQRPTGLAADHHPGAAGSLVRRTLVILLCVDGLASYVTARLRVVSVERRMIRGTAEAIGAVLAVTKSGSGITTASIERLNATFRAALVPLVRQGRVIAHTEAVLTAGR
jgi:hypothetical protein